MPLLVNSAPHNFGFKTYSPTTGGVNRAVVLTTGTGSLPAGTNLALGPDWRIKMRVRQQAATATYAVRYGSADNTDDTAADVLAIIYGFRGGAYELYSVTNGSGSTVRLTMNTVVTDALFHDVEFRYSNSLLTAYLDGTENGSLGVSNFTPLLNSAYILSLAQRPGNPAFTGAFDSLLISSGATVLVDFSFNEESGNAVNAGTMGGQMVFTNGGIREIL